MESIKRVELFKSFEHLPARLLIEILYRLPSKSIFRFKSVSKQWLSLISDPSFTRIYFSRPQPWTLLCKEMYIEKCNEESHEFDLNANEFRPSHPKSPSFSVLAFPHSLHHCKQSPLLRGHERRKSWFSPLKNAHRILAVSNGLLLCRHHLHSPNCPRSHECVYKISSCYVYHYTCNPITRQWIMLPPPPLSLNLLFVSEGFITQLEKVGVISSYKVVRLSLREPSMLLNFEVFSSETGEWNVHKVYSRLPLKLHFYGDDDVAIEAKGILRWFDKLSHVLISYNPYTNIESCRVITFPGRPYLFAHKSLWLFGSIHGSLRCNAVAPYNSGYLLTVWTLEDNDTGDWRLDHRVELHIILKEIRFLKPKAFNPIDSDTLYMWDGSMFYSYSARTTKLEVVHVPRGYESRVPHWGSVLPFVLPPWPTTIPHPTWKATGEWNMLGLVDIQ